MTARTNSKIRLQAILKCLFKCGSIQPYCRSRSPRLPVPSLQRRNAWKVNSSSLACENRRQSSTSLAARSEEKRQFSQAMSSFPQSCRRKRPASWSIKSSKKLHRFFSHVALRRVRSMSHKTMVLLHLLCKQLLAKKPLSAEVHSKRK